MNRKSLIFSSLAILIVIAVASYFFLNSAEETTYEAIMNEVIGDEGVESIIVKDFQDAETENHKLIEDQKVIEEFIEKPSEMILKETNDVPDDGIYSVSMFSNGNNIVFTLGNNNVIRIAGNNDKIYFVEGENTLLHLAIEILK